MDELFRYNLGIGLSGIVLLTMLPIKSTRWVLTTLTLVTVILSSLIATEAMMGRTDGISIGYVEMLGPIILKIDALSAWFVLIANVGVLLAVFHATSLPDNDTPNIYVRMHYLALAVLHQSLVWVLSAQNGFIFLFAWEIMSLSSALLLLNGPVNPKTLLPIVSYLVQMHLSGICLAMAFIWMYVSTESLDMGLLSQFLNSGSGIWPFLLFFIGFGLKAEFVPLHGKVPHAYRTASPHVAAILSGVMVKMGIFGLLKIAIAQQNNLVLLGEIVLTVSFLSALYGAMNTAVHRNIFRMLSYCTIENVGLMGVGIGLGMIGLGMGMPWLATLGFCGTLLHILNHSLGKMLLFYSGGWAIVQARTYDMDQMGGLAKQMPKTAVLFLIGALALCGLPPFNGFVSEFMLYAGLVHGLNADKLELVSLLVLGLGVMALIGGMAIHAFTKTFSVAFLGQWRNKHPQPLHEASLKQLMPQFFLVALMLSVALLPEFYIGLSNRILIESGLSVASPNGIETSPLLSAVGHINLYALLLLGIVAFIWLIRYKTTQHKARSIQPTWGCANRFSGAKLQYTGKSFTKSLGKIFGFVIVEQKSYKEIDRNHIFPAGRKYASHYHDLVEQKLLDPLLQRLVFVANYFKFIQNGRVQSYVLYGIVYILAIFVLTLFTILP
ncbi:MAG: proton-conducting transporter membrane subunit [Breznakibacter sp.]